MARGSTVYVGNIDFDIPEQRVIEELSKIGRIVNFRMMIDKQTGKPKGYGFCEYESSLVAEAAVQKLKITFNNRQLKINYADIDTTTIKKDSEMPINNLITVLNQMEKSNLKDVMMYLKKMAIDQPKKLTKLMEENENLGIAIFQCFIELGLVEQESVYEMLKSNFKIEDNHIVVLERICEIGEEELECMEKGTRDKIMAIREMFMKK